MNRSWIISELSVPLILHTRISTITAERCEQIYSLLSNHTGLAPRRYRSPVAMAAHLAGRLLLLLYLRGAYPDAVNSPLVFGENGRPCFADPVMPSFSISHSADRAALALYDKRVGLDIEKAGGRQNIHELAAHVFSGEEREIYRRTPFFLRERLFYAVWTRKESYLKYTGCGIDRPLSEIPVSAGEGKAVFPDNTRIISLKKAGLYISLCIGQESGSLRVVTPSDIMIKKIPFKKLLENAAAIV